MKKFTRASKILFFTPFVFLILFFVPVAKSEGMGKSKVGNKKEESSSDESMVFCAMDAKLCPDGEYVSRDPANNCEFRPCKEKSPSKSPFPIPSCSSEKVEGCSETPE